MDRPKPEPKTRDIRAYAPVKEAAKERQGKRNDLRPNIVERIPQSSPKPEPKTRDIRAKAAAQ